MSYIPAAQVFAERTRALAAQAPRAPEGEPAPTPAPTPEPTPTLAQRIEALPATPTDTWPETLFDRERQRAFLLELAECGQVRAASARARISYRTVYRERRVNAAFARAWDAALLSARVFSEDALACRALDGVEEVVWFRGEEVGRRVRYDSRLLLAHLARLDRLTEDARLRAYAGDLDGALERYVAGCDDPAPVCADCGAPLPMVSAPPARPSDPAAAQDGQCNGTETAAAAFTPGPCDRCDMPSARTSAEQARLAKQEAERERREAPCARCGGRCNDPDAGRGPDDCGLDEDARYEAMHEARPADAPWPDEFPGFDEAAVEAAQLAAFEAGVERWWLVVAAGEGEGPGAWHWAEAAAGA